MWKLFHENYMKRTMHKMFINTCTYKTNKKCINTFASLRIYIACWSSWFFVGTTVHRDLSKTACTQVIKHETVKCDESSCVLSKLASWEKIKCLYGRVTVFYSTFFSFSLTGKCITFFVTLLGHKCQVFDVKYKFIGDDNIFQI